MSESSENVERVISCCYCERTFSQNKNMYRHVQRFHKNKPIDYKRKSNIICALCDERHITVKTYWDHIRSKHPEVQLSFEKKFFYSEEDFDTWKKETEARTLSHFRFSRAGTVLSDGSVVNQFHCDRSGFYTPPATRTRKCASKKIGKFCPAYIYRTKTVFDDLMEIEVDFQTTHAGHKFDVHSLRIRSEKRERRLRNQGKGRWPKKPETPPRTETEGNEPVVYYDAQSDSFITEVSDILQRDPNLEIKQVTCSCEEYTAMAACEHIKELLKSLKDIKSVQENIKVDESNVIIDTSSTATDVSSAVDATSLDANREYVAETGHVIPVENDNTESLEDSKASIVEEFRQITNMCQSREHLEILKEVVAEGKKRLVSSINCQQKDSELSSNMHEEYHMTSESPKLNELMCAIPPSNQTTLSLPSYENNIIYLKNEMTHMPPALPVFQGFSVPEIPLTNIALFVV